MIESDSIEIDDIGKEKSISKRTIFLWIFAILFILIIFSVIAYYVPWVELIEGFFIETESLGFLGNFLLIFGFIIISFPFTFGYIPLSLGAGYLYGVFMGTITSTIGSTLGSGLCFWMTRKILKPFCLSRMSSIPYANSFLGDEVSIEFTAAVLWRFAPIPFGFSNSLFALSSITFPKYIISTIIGLLPFQIMWVFLGTTLRSLADVAAGNVEGSALQLISLAVQLFAAIIVPVYVCYRSTHKNNISEDEEVELNDILEV